MGGYSWVILGNDGLELNYFILLTRIGYTGVVSMTIEYGWSIYRQSTLKLLLTRHLVRRLFGLLKTIESEYRKKERTTMNRAK